MIRLFYIVAGLGLIIGSGFTAWDSANLSAGFLGEQFKVPNLGYVIAGAVIILGAVIAPRFKERCQMRYYILAAMLGFMGADGSTNILAQWNKVMEAKAAKTLRAEALAELLTIGVERKKLEGYKPDLSGAKLIAANPDAAQADVDAAVRRAQAVVNAEGYPIAIDGDWGPNTKGAVNDYLPKVRERIAELVKAKAKHDATLEQTAKALEFTLTGREAILYGAGMTFGGWMLSFLGGFLMSLGPTKAERAAQARKADKKAAALLKARSAGLRQQATQVRDIAAGFRSAEAA